MRFEPFAPQEAAWREAMDRLRFGWGKWDLDVAGKATVARGALVLSRREHDEVVAAAEALAGLTAKARERLVRDPDALRGLGVYPKLAEAVADEPPGPLVTRIDFFQTADGWQVSEFNDDCPGGYNEALGLPVELASWLPDGCTAPGDLPDALVRLFGGDGTSALLYATGYAEDLQVVDLLSRLLRGQGCATLLASPAHLDPGGQARVLGQDVDRIVRFFPAEWLTALPNWDAWASLGRAGVPVRNPLAAAATQSKAVHAWLWSESRGADRGLVERLLPRTAALDESTAAQALARPERSVLKPAFGRMGEGVVLGRGCPPEAWRKSVAAALRSRRARPYVVQDRFDAVPVETGPGRTATACLGAYVVAGRFAGYYSRLSAAPVVAYDASNVLTVVAGL
jgi:glutathionylspermidine synthase